MRLLLLQHDRPFSRRLAAALAGEPLVQCTVRDLAEPAEVPAACWDGAIVDWPRERADRFELLGHWQEQTRSAPLVAVTDIRDEREVERLIRAGVADVCGRSGLDAEHLLLRMQLTIERPRTAVDVPAPARQREAALIGAAADCSAADAPPPPPVPLTLPDTLRVLLVPQARRCEPRLEELLREALASDFEMVTAADFSAADELVEQEPFDLVLVDLEKASIAALYAVESMRIRAASTTIIVATERCDARFAGIAVQRGADDYLDRSQLTRASLAHVVRMAMVRRRQLLARRGNVLRHAVEMPGSCQHAADRRGAPRYILTQPVMAIPIRDDGSPAETLSAVGFTLDISDRGIGFELPGSYSPDNNLMLLGVETAGDGTYHFATVEVTRQREVAGHRQVGAAFVEPERDLLRDENLRPSVRPDSLTYATGLPTAVLNQWVELGLLQPVLIDRIYVCPRCRAVPAFRSGCHACGSIHVASHQLVHHFACAYVGMIGEFQKHGQFACPKCQATDLKSGIDYELLHGPYHCLDCNWSDNVTELVGRCLKCSWRFPISQAAEEELIGYHANRLDPQDLLNGE